MNKKVIWIGIASALLVGGGIFWWMRTKKKAEKEALEKAEEDAKKAEEDAKNKAEQDSKSETKPNTETKPESKSFDLKDELKKFAGKRFIAKKLINSFTSEYTTKPYIKGGGDSKGNFEQGQYVGVLIDLKKDPLKNKIVAKFKNISSYTKDINDKAMFEFWVNWADVITAI